MDESTALPLRDLLQLSTPPTSGRWMLAHRLDQCYCGDEECSWSRDGLTPHGVYPPISFLLPCPPTEMRADCVRFHGLETAWHELLRYDLALISAAVDFVNYPLLGYQSLAELGGGKRTTKVGLVNDLLFK